MRGAIVGCGYVSQFHLRAWHQVPSVSIEAAGDLDARRAQARAAEFAVPRTCSDAARMLDEVRPHFLDVARVFTRTRRTNPALAGEDLAVVLMEFADQGLGPP
jgi:predicted dehydrogenase